MNKFLVLLLCAALGAGVLTMTSMASQRNAWQEEAEKLEKQMKKAESTHEKEMTEMEEALLSAQLERDAYALLQQASDQGIINFVGNAEARDVPLGLVDVVVCDGFAGNVLLKSIEGTAMFMGSLMKHKIFKRSLLSKIGYLFCKKGVDEVMGMLDYRTIGGTQFLGIRKPVIKAHGASDALAFRNAVRQAMDAAKTDFSAELEESLTALTEKESEND